MPFNVIVSGAPHQAGTIASKATHSPESGAKHWQEQNNTHL